MPRTPRDYFLASVFILSISILPLGAYADQFEDALNQGVAYYQAGMYETAIRSFKEAAKSPDKEITILACVDTGFCFNVLGDQNQAIAWFERALAFDQNYLSALEGLSLSCFGDKKNYEKGYRYAARAEALFSSEGGVYYNMACYFGYKGDAASALKYVDKALFFGFTDLDLMSTDADFAGIRKKRPFDSLQANLPSLQNALALRSRAEDQGAKGNYTEALVAYQQAIDSCRVPLGKDSLTESSLLSSMGNACVYLNKYQQALETYKGALAIQQMKLGKMNPHTADRYIYIGRTYYLLTRYDDAIDNYLEALTIQVRTLGENSVEVRNTYNNLGGTYSAKGKYGEAAAYFKKALLTIDASTPEGAAEKMATESKLGNVLWAGSRYAEAIESYKNSLATQIAALGPDHPDVARTYAIIGGAQLALGEFDQAEKSYSLALDIQQKSSGAEKADIIATYEGMAALYYARSEFDRALERYSRDLVFILEAFGESSLEAARCYQGLGATAYSLGRYAESVAYYEKAGLIYARALGDANPEVARCLLGVGASRYTEGLYDQAITDYSKALAIQLDAYGENNIDVAKNYLGLGLSYYSKGEFPKAIAYYEMAAAIQKTLLGDFNPDLSRSYMNLGVAYTALRDFANAIAYINKCYSIQIKILGPLHLDVSVSLKMVGGILCELGDFKSAIEYYQRALDIETGILGNDHQQVAETLNNMGTAYASLGEYGKATEKYRESLGIHEKIFGKESALLALDYLNIGSAYSKTADTEIALESLRTARDLARNSPDRQLGTQIAETLGNLFLDRGKFPEAKKAFQEGIDIIEKARTDIGSAKAEFMARNVGLYYLSIKADAALKDMDGVFAAAESLKARGYLENISLAGALEAGGVSEKDRKRMLELNEQLGKLLNVQLEEIDKPADVQDKDTLLSVTAQIKSLETEFGKLDQALMSVPRYRELRRPAMAVLRDAQKSLQPGQAFVDYILNGEGTSWFARCLVIKRDSIALVDLDSSFDYAKAVQDLRASIKDKDKGADALIGRAYDALIKPLEPMLAGLTQLIIVPDGSLAVLPFDALRKNGNSPYLGKTFQITLTPSVSVFKMTDGRAYGSRTGEWLGLGGVAYADEAGTDGDEGRGLSLTNKTSDKTKSYYASLGPEAYFGALGFKWRNLPGTAVEVDTIAKNAYSGKGVKLLLGEQASESTIKKLSDSGELAQQRIVHFACHAFFDNDFPQYSALVLAEAGAMKGKGAGITGYLTVQDVALLRFNADLVALSACETGEGGGRLQGDGLVGFARSLLVAGANRAQVTLWPVDDAATRDFMIRWYTLIKKEGMDYSKALAQVKREFMKSSAYSDPVYWSGFVLYGR
jgi:tetratricopeptide (TPR) repeat protein